MKIRDLPDIAPDLDEILRYFHETFTFKNSSTHELPHSRRLAEFHYLSPHLFGRETVLGISRDISAVYELRKQIQKNEEYLTSVFHLMPVGILELSAEGKVIRMNEAAEKITDFSTRYSIGLPHERILHFVPPDPEHPVKSPIHAAMKSGERQIPG